MINLYQRLQLPPNASTADIEHALAQAQHSLNEQEIQAVKEWLLVAEVRTRYDARLRQEQPAFFASPEPQKQPAPSESDRSEYYTPKLYNPTAVAIWAILFSPIIGAWLCAINWRELGNEKAARHNMYVVYGSIGFGLFSVLLYLLGGVSVPIYAGSFISLAWFVSLGKTQADFLRREAGNDYARQKWGKVIMWIILGMLIYLFVFYALLYLITIAGWLHPNVVEDLQRALLEATQNP